MNRVFIIFMAVLLLFWGNSELLITDVVEANYALTAKEMVLSNNWLSPTIFGNYWFDKPVMFYWLLAGAFKTFGISEFAARFVPAIFGLAGLVLLMWSAKKICNEKVEFFSALILLSSVEFFLISKSIITDAVLFFFMSATLICFYIFYDKKNIVYLYIAAVCSGGAVLTKGPIGILLPGLIILIFLVYERNFKILWTKHLLGSLIIFLGVTLPWYSTMYFVHGNAFLDTFLGVHNYLRATVSEHPKNNVFYYYTVVGILAFFPWSFIFFPDIISCIKETIKERDSLTTYLVIWILTIFIFFQCMATKYITYTYPILFPCSLLFGRYLEKFVPSICKTHKILRQKTKVFSAIAGVFICIYLVLIQTFAIPFTNYKSSKDLLSTLRINNINNCTVFGPYPTSISFYSEITPRKLVEKDNIESFLPKSASWSSKNVMPYTLFDDKEYQYVVVDRDKIEKFYETTNRSWQIVDNVKYWIVLRANS